ncbi:MAG: ABC transporter substrate-binding protein [Candidatus Gracilibacteria bacterium]|nr:ABC transporter substrate-binding protein [Candidatus Gracilibacteria bacterium]
MLLITTQFGYLYFLGDAKKIPVEGGVLREGIVGSFPNLNPLITNTDYNKYIVNLLYGSLLTYDIKTNEIVGDLAKCDLSNLSYIECNLKDNAKWSNGKEITITDVLGTYNIIKNTSLNPSMTSLLQNVTIEEKNGAIIFKNNKKDVKFLNILFQPIVSKEILDNISNTELFGNFSRNNGIYSGPYIIEKRLQEENSGVEKLSLIKNSDYSGTKNYISRISFRFFADNLELLKNKEKLNAFNDTENILGNSIPRLQENNYILSQYSTIFLNKEKIVNPSLRSFLLDKINRTNIVKTLGETKYKEIKNPFISDYLIDKEPKNKNVVLIMKENNFYKKSELVENILNAENKQALDNATKLADTQTKYITSTDKTIRKYTFTSNSNILLKGTVNDDKIDAIYINNIKLQSYKTGDKNFYFRLSTAQDYRTLKEGKNTYNLYFEKAGKKSLKESFNVIYYKDKAKLTTEKENIIKSLTQPGTTTDKQLQAKIDKIKTLDDKYFYDKDLKRFEINLDYIGIQEENKTVADLIKNNIESYGIVVNLREIDTIKTLNEKIKNGNKDYDMILAGVNLGNFDFNLFDYFHSSQAKSGYNLSNVKRLDLDIALEALKTNLKNKSETESLEKQILDILRQEQIIKTIESPYIKYLVDKNIKDLSVSDKIPDTSYRFMFFNNSYILENKQINWDTKSIKGFFVNLINILKK